MMHADLDVDAPSRDQALGDKDKAAMIQGVFDRVASRYDLMNDLMSLGAHRCWKDALLRRLRPRDSERILDIAGGTGDIALRIRRWSSAQVLILDKSPAMLRLGYNRALNHGILTGMFWTIGDAEQIPCSDAEFDACIIAFGLRNVIYRQRALREAYRVLKPGGRFICLEFSQVVIPGLRELYHAYSRVLPKLGALVARDEAAYLYLVESIAAFPNREQLADAMRQAGFSHIVHHGLAGGIVALHQGWRI